MLYHVKILLRQFRASSICSLLMLGCALQVEAMAQLNVAVEVNPDPAMPESILYARITVSNTATALPDRFGWKWSTRRVSRGSSTFCCRTEGTVPPSCAGVSAMPGKSCSGIWEPSGRVVAER